MRFFRIILLAFVAVLFGVAFAPDVRADQWDKKTIVTFDQDVAIPGQILPAGTYVFKLLRTSSGSRNVVQIWDGDEMRLVTTLLTNAEYARETPEQAFFVLDNSNVNEGFPPAIVTWFYPGDNTGWAFVYSK